MYWLVLAEAWLVVLGSLVWVLSSTGSITDQKGDNDGND